jgi:hypothetical protein
MKHKKSILKNYMRKQVYLEKLMKLLEFFVRILEMKKEIPLQIFQTLKGHQMVRRGGIGL